LISKVDYITKVVYINSPPEFTEGKKELPSPKFLEREREREQSSRTENYINPNYFLTPNKEWSGDVYG
jgi:hypothetical protein